MLINNKLFFSYDLFSLLLLLIVVFFLLALSVYFFYYESDMKFSCHSCWFVVLFGRSHFFTFSFFCPTSCMCSLHCFSHWYSDGSYLGFLFCFVLCRKKRRRSRDESRHHRKGRTDEISVLSLLSSDLR